MSTKHDLLGKIFGQGIVIEELSQRDSSNKIVWKLKCSCGNIYYSTTQSLIGNVTKNCGCVIKEKNNLVGKTFYNKKVIRYIGSSGQSKNKKPTSLWECQCICGQTFISETSKVKRKCNPNKCGCQNRKIANFTNNNSELKIEIKKHLARAKTKIKYRGVIEFNLTPEQLESLYLKQDKKCAISGIEINFGKNKTASIDRIDSSKGYSIDNVQWVHKAINQMKWLFSLEEFIAWCKLVAKNNPNSIDFVFTNNDVWDKWCGFISRQKNYKRKTRRETKPSIKI